jgi:alkylation response protein AidB-like acyl-CoA dehydrogenase
VGPRSAVSIADDVLFPDAAAVDGADRVPAAHLDLLAASGYYGLDGFDELAPAVEAFAGGCLATALVWTQHRGPLTAAAGTPWSDALSRGERRAGIALVGLRTPQPLRVRRSGGDFVLDGTVPFVSGWGLVDILMIAARDADDLVHFLFVDADPAPTVTARRLDLVAAHASRTVTLTYDGHRVPGARLMSTEQFSDWTAADACGSALNGFLALGVAARCCRLLGPGPLDADVASARAALTAAGRSRSGTGIAAARALSSEVAWRAAGALTARTGSRAVLAGHHAQRLAREATLLLAFGTRPSIRDSLLARLGA